MTGVQTCALPILWEFLSASLVFLSSFFSEKFFSMLMRKVVIEPRSTETKINMIKGSKVQRQAANRLKNL